MCKALGRAMPPSARWFSTLGLLPPSDYERLRPHLQRIPLTYRQSLYRARKPIGFVYFIETGVGSLVNTMANGDAADDIIYRFDAEGRTVGTLGTNPEPWTYLTHVIEGAVRGKARRTTITDRNI